MLGCCYHTRNQYGVTLESGTSHIPVLGAQMAIGHRVPLVNAACHSHSLRPSTTSFASVSFSCYFQYVLTQISHSRQHGHPCYQIIQLAKTAKSLIILEEDRIRQTKVQEGASLLSFYPMRNGLGEFLSSLVVFTHAEPIFLPFDSARADTPCLSPCAETGYPPIILLHHPREPKNPLHPWLICA